MKKRPEPRSRRGFTLVELMVGMVIATMASAVVVSSLAFSLKFFQSRSEDTAAQLLCETVSLLVQNELTEKKFDNINTGDYTCTNGKAPPIGGVELPDKCYGNTGSRKVAISVVKNETGKYCQVTVTVTGGDVLTAKNEFTVTPLGG